MASALETEAQVKRRAKEAAEVERLYFTGWGSNSSIAYVIALKIKETRYVMAEGLQLEQYLHSPYVAPLGQGLERARTILSAAKTVGVATALIAEQGDDTLADLADTVIHMPATLEALSTIVYLVPLQFLTYWLAMELGCNPYVFRLDNTAHEAARRDYQP